MAQKKYVDIDINVHTGQKAEQLISKDNDLKYLTEDGIIFVDNERWQRAQTYENRTWMVQCLCANDDHNGRNMEKFDNFARLEGLSPKSIIELGCGPFTNMRLFVPLFPSIEKVSLLDPLITSYLNHPNCSYKDGTLCGKKVDLISWPIENFCLNDVFVSFDIVMMINVLEHCQSVSIIFENIKNIMKEGSIFIFSDMVLDIEVIKKMTENAWDAGHPIRISKNYMERFLDNFETLYRKDEKIMLNADLDGGYEATWFYFIGKYKGKNNV